MAEFDFNNKKPKKTPPFTSEMKKELKEFYHIFTVEELATYFNRNIKQVKNQAQRQYLSKRGKS